MRVDALRYAFEVDVDAEYLDWLQAVQSVLRRGGQVRKLDLELCDLADAKWHDQQDQASESDDDRDKNNRDGKDSRHTGRMQPSYRGLNEECDGRPENKGTEKVPQEEENDNRDDERRDAERDLQIATAPLRIERPR